MNKNFCFNAKMIFFLCMLIPIAGISQTKNVISTHRVFPKMDKALEFEKAIAAHAQKYHTGDAHCGCLPYNRGRIWEVFMLPKDLQVGKGKIREEI